MNSALPVTGTVGLLEELSLFVPDAFINQWVGGQRGPGRRRRYSPAQLYRLLLLALLTPAHSFNLLVALLAEHRPWRRFARLANQREIPDATLLHDFRARLGVSGLRAINAHLLGPLLSGGALGAQTVAIMDATDLPAATHAYKKSSRGGILPGVPRRAHARSRAGRVAGMSATRSTPCGCGSTAMSPAWCWCPWSVGLRRPIAMKWNCSGPPCTTVGDV